MIHDKNKIILILSCFFLLNLSSIIFVQGVFNVTKIRKNWKLLGGKESFAEYRMSVVDREPHLSATRLSFLSFRLVVTKSDLISHSQFQ